MFRGNVRFACHYKPSMCMLVLSVISEGCSLIPNICTLRTSISNLEDENAALREAYSVNFTVALKEYERVRDALYK